MPPSHDRGTLVRGLEQLQRCAFAAEQDIGIRTVFSQHFTVSTALGIWIVDSDGIGVERFF